MAQKKYVSLSKLSTFLDNLKSTFSELSHKHTINDISDYTVDASLSSTSVNPVQNKVIDAEFKAVADSINTLESSVDEVEECVFNVDYNELAFDTTEIVVDTSASATTSVLGRAILGQMILS